MPKWTTILVETGGRIVRVGRVLVLAADVERMARSLGRRVNWEHAENDCIATMF